jgi:hypothetical protein
MKMKISDDVRRTYKRVIVGLGETFSFKSLVVFTELERNNKPLRFEEVSGPLAVTGYVKPLKDMDLIETRAGMDEDRIKATRLHEIAHLLLCHIDEYPEGEEHTETYEQWIRNGRKHESSLRRDHKNTEDRDLRENDAEALATLLLGCIIRKEAMPPPLAKDVYWEN